MSYAQCMPNACNISQPCWALLNKSLCFYKQITIRFKLFKDFIFWIKFLAGKRFGVFHTLSRPLTYTTDCFHSSWGQKKPIPAEHTGLLRCRRFVFVLIAHLFACKYIFSSILSKETYNSLGVSYLSDLWSQLLFQISAVAKWRKFAS